MEFRILGPTEVVDDGEPIDIGSRQQRGLLALLVLNANRVVSTDRILEEFWGDDPAGKERTLWVYISRLRAILEPGRHAHAKGRVLVTRDRGYSLLVDDSNIDAVRFEHMATAGARLLRDDPAAAVELLDDALALWRGSALEDHRYDDFAQADCARLDELRLEAFENRIDAKVRSDRHRDVVGELEQLVVEHPHRERLVELQMIALYRSGRQADSLRAFERFRRRLDDELGIVPSPELCRLEEQVLLHDERLTPPPPDGAAPAVDGDIVSPFKGLHAFGESDASNFFGRDRLVADVVRQIDEGARLHVLVGASGSGKSSLLRAGLVPAIRKGALDGSESWLIVHMVPGDRPFEELAAALSRSTLDALDALEGLRDLLDDPEDGVLRACLHLLPDPDDRLLLVIDQFEELFTLGSPGERNRFIRNLEVALDDAHGRVVAAIALRADFYGRPLDYPRFAQLVGDGVVNVVPMTPDELELAAELPAERVGVSLDPALLVQLLGDVAGQVGGLPLFQYALTELFERRNGSVLTIDAYQEMGGVSGALARRAEDLFLSLDTVRRHATKQLFLRLVTIVERSGWGRRRVTGTEIATIAVDLVALQFVLRQFGSSRLLTFDRDPISGSPTVEVAHEALLFEWPRLRRWVEDGRSDVMHHARLLTALAEWTTSGEHEDYLLSGSRLTDYTAWAAASSLELSRTEQRFLDRSVEKQLQQDLAEERRHAREVKRDRQARTRLWGLGIVAALIAATTLAGYLVFSGGGQPAVAVVHGVPGDSGMNDMMIGGAGLAEGNHDLLIDLEPPLIDPEEHLRLLAEAGNDLIIVGREFDLPFDTVASDYPDVHWVAIDPVAVHDTGPNITEIHFAVEDSAFLAGAAAALSSSSGRIGFIGGLQSFRTEAARNGFEQGARSEVAGVDVVSTFVGPVVDPLSTAERSVDLVHQLATDMYRDGVDVIFHDAGVAGAGVIDAASDWSADHPVVWTIGSDADQFWTVAPDLRRHVLTSTLKRFDIAVELAVDGYLRGELPAGETVLGLDASGVGLSRSGGLLGAASDARIKLLEAEIGAGHIVVSPHAARPPAWQAIPDVVASFRVTDDVCALEGPIEGSIGRVTTTGESLAVERGSTVLFELTNDSSDIAALIVRDLPAGVTVEDLDRQALSGIPTSMGVLVGNSVAQLGASTSSAAKVDRSRIVASCVVGDPGDPTAQHYPLIVRPT